VSQIAASSRESPKSAPHFGFSRLFPLLPGVSNQLHTHTQLAGEQPFETLRVSQTIRGGQVAVTPDGVQYRPRPGFRGTDQFVCTLLAADGSPRERVQVAVTVR